MIVLEVPYKIDKKEFQTFIKEELHGNFQTWLLFKSIKNILYQGTLQAADK
jgi:hypothetical protein